MRINHDITIEPNQSFDIDLFRPEDAKGIAHLFYAIYGSAYPIETYYMPDRITEENQKGNIYSIVGRTEKGDIIAHGAMYRSSPPNRDLYEGGQYLVLPSYRKTFAIYKINRYIFDILIPRLTIDGIYGESVCNHIISQKIASRSEATDVAIEIDVMPQEAYTKEQSAPGRVSCIIQLHPYNDSKQEVFIPSVYREEIDYILSDLNIQRTITYSTEPIPYDIKSNISVNFFPYASVGRFNIIMGGSDFDMILEELEQKGKDNNTLVFQFFINLEKPWAGRIIEKLRKKGYFLGGYIPAWFKNDGILMQKTLTTPDFNSIKLYTEKAKKLLEIIKSDREQSVKLQ
ncbi:MAG: hypothetical protein ABRQ38_17040 [Candidatus Eremiobacterota bacterium]